MGQAPGKFKDYMQRTVAETSFSFTFPGNSFPVKNVQPAAYDQACSNQGPSVGQVTEQGIAEQCCPDQGSVTERCDH